MVSSVVALGVVFSLPFLLMDVLDTCIPGYIYIGISLAITYKQFIHAKVYFSNIIEFIPNISSGTTCV